MLLQPGHDRAQDGQLAVEDACGMRFDLDDRIAARTVQRAVEQAVAVEQRKAENPFDLVGESQRGSRAA
tara:strand:- start:624 stop:830 length:207 start_codon:yes stop_codon:yes gene_type:complete